MTISLEEQMAVMVDVGFLRVLGARGCEGEAEAALFGRISAKLEAARRRDAAYEVDPAASAWYELSVLGGREVA